MWVRHSPSLVGRVTRDTFLVPRVARRHHVEVVTWNTRETSGSVVGCLAFGVRDIDGVRTWVLPRLPRPPGWPPWRASINEPLFRVALRTIIRRVRADVVVVGPSWPQVGFPPKTDALQVFDYLDGSDASERRWIEPELALVRWSDAAVCVSDALAERVRNCAKPAIVISNGVDVDAFAASRAQRAEIRNELGVSERRLVTLVGLTAAADEYWIRAVRDLAQRIPGFLFAAVGTGALAPRLMALMRELPDAVRFVGPVPYEQATRWFVASDVTWYPGADTEYFHVASPLKIYEGLAAGTQVVVAPRLRSLSGLSTPALHFAEPTAEAFAGATERALSDRSFVAPDVGFLAAYSWDRLADRLCAFLESMAYAKEVDRSKR